MKGHASFKIPYAVWAIAFCAFGIGTTEFVLVGLLPQIAVDLAISISSTGSLVTLYALGVAIGGPVFTAIMGKTEHKKIVLITLAVFIVGNGIALFANTRFLLQISRVITGTAHGVFFAYAVIIASNMAAENKKATAISMVFAGLMISTVVGVPIGTYIGSRYGWKMTFLAIVLWGITGLVILSWSVPRQQKPSNILKLADLPKVLKNKSLLIVLFANIFAYTGTFVMFTYLSPILENVTGFSVDKINFIFLIFGTGVALGNMVGGRIANQKPSESLVCLLFFHAILLFILSMVIQDRLFIVIILLPFGFFAYSNVPALQWLTVQYSERKLKGSGGIASALSVSAFNIGAASGSFIGGFVVEGPLTIKATPWVGGIFVIVALGLSVWNLWRGSIPESNN